ncbi:SDR family NAD(P)-dependent oxidoreductase [Bacillus sp. es.036]|uniref:SDR family NAD(P)-dependent oxidoreductase n=1 Tax=Bacillus sp. es.036 TaxID=1761764 RepID=UPI000BFA7ECC|nr:SDR family NAD(P)-dependent oxidoreductase [Bacillus sp. es.036]PFG15057.1 NAD(P)-dependent dehydrogenase (short-subunit alcohol dehydrogenase family) [Bacillus sp. es.036]
MARLQEKVVIVTGGSGEIGKEAARLFLKEGAKVTLVDINEEALQQTRSELESFGEIISVKADVSKESDVQNYVQETMDRFGKIDVFFNNAGIEGKVAPIIEQKVEDFEKVLSVNVIGVFLGLKHVLPVMTEQNSGSIINTSSVAGLMGSPGVSPYVTSKHGVIGLTKTAALEAAGYQVRVNSIHPSPVEGRMMTSLEEGMNPGKGEEVHKQQTAAIPLQRYGETKDIANLVLFLASDESKFITGSQYRVDGGIGAS